MTVRIEPTNGASVQRQISSRRMAAASRYGGSDWIVPDTRDINATRDAALASGPLGGFDRIDGDDTNQTVQFDTGEAFVGGAYIASDDSSASEHTVGPLPDSTTTTIYLGWDLSSADTLIIGQSGDFASTDPKVELWEVTTDGSGITSDQDLRTTAPSDERGDVILDVTDTDDTTALSADTGTLSTTYARYEITVERECDDGSLNFMNARVNGVTSGDYFMDIYDAFNDSFASKDNQSEFLRIAGTQDGGGGYRPSVAQQTIVIGHPSSITDFTSTRGPLIWTRDEGVGKNIDYLGTGHLDVDTGAVDRIELFGGSASTGRIQIRGVDPFQ